LTRSRFIYQFILFVALLLSLLSTPTLSRADVQPHYWLDRPLPPSSNTRIDRGLPYGWTSKTGSTRR
jgi:hypothetical protein